MPIAEHRPTDAALFTEAIVQHFQGLQDPLCRVDGYQSGRESLKLYPTSPLYGFPGLHDVVIVAPERSGADTDLLPVPSLSASPRLDIAYGRESVSYSAKGPYLAKQTRKSPRLITLDQAEAQEILAFTQGLSERPKPLYYPQPGTEYIGDWKWAARYQPRKPLERQVVLDAIHRSLEAYRYAPGLSREEIENRGLSGILLGRDENAETVTDIIFTSDTSLTHGLRNNFDSDQHVLQLADQYNWREHPESELIMQGLAWAIIGRNKDQYGGKAAFTFDEVQRKLPANSRLLLKSGYHFAGRPHWDEPYGERALLAQAALEPGDGKARLNLVDELSELAWALNRQKRWTSWMIARTVTYTSNA